MVDTYPGPLGEIRAASAAAGTALTTTAGYIQLPLGTRHVKIEGRNYSTAVVAQVLFNPWLIVLLTRNRFDRDPADFSNNAQDGSTTTRIVLNGMPTLANGGALWVGAGVPFAGASIDVQDANAISSTLTVTYWDGTTMTSTSATDNTASSGATLATDATVTWTVPTAWQSAPLRTILGQIADPVASGVHIPFDNLNLYWTRWVVSAALTDPTTLNSLVAINRSTAYYELTSARVLETHVKHGAPGGIGCIQAKTDAGTANLIVNVAAGDGHLA